MSPSRFPRIRALSGALSAVVLATVLPHAHAAISVTAADFVYAENFDSLPNANGSDPAWTNDGTLAGWYIQAGPQLNQTVSHLRVSTSSGSDRAHISYGRHGETDRAFGSQAGSSHRYNASEPEVGDPFGAVAVAFVNDTGTMLNGFSFDYTGEQWHVSSNANVAHSLIVQYAVGVAGTAFHQLDWQYVDPSQAHAAGASFFTPTLSGGTTGNGNLAQNRVEGLGATVSGIEWQADHVLWLRWVDINDSASDHGMAIDDFSLRVAAVPEPEACALMLAGLGLVGFMARRRARR